MVGLLLPTTTVLLAFLPLLVLLGRGNDGKLPDVDLELLRGTETESVAGRLRLEPALLLSERVDALAFLFCSAILHRQLPDPGNLDGSLRFESRTNEFLERLEDDADNFAGLSSLFSDLSVESHGWIILLFGLCF